MSRFMKYQEMISETTAVRQRATAIYLIDKLALRVGNEKDTSEVFYPLCYITWI